jgi:hypothetical protein
MINTTNMYTSLYDFEASTLRAPVPIFIPSVGGTVYYGDMAVRQRAATNKVFSKFEFVVGQIVEKVCETDIIVNCFATREVDINTYLRETP